MKWWKISSQKVILSTPVDKRVEITHNKTVTSAITKARQNSLKIVVIKNSASVAFSLPPKIQESIFHKTKSVEAHNELCMHQVGCVWEIMKALKIILLH